MKLFVSALFIVLGISFIGCEPKLAGRKYDISDTLKRAIDIKVGSCFIYKDSLTQQLDSFYVDYYKDAWMGGSDKAPDEFHEIAYEMIDTSVSLFQIKCGAPGSDLVCTSNWGYLMPIASLPFVEGRVLSKTLNSFDGSPDTIKTFLTSMSIKYYSSLTINNNIYTDVYEQVNVETSNKNDDTSYFHSFYSVGSGLVKFCHKTNSEGRNIWELERSKIFR